MQTISKIERYRDGYELRHHDEYGIQVFIGSFLPDSLGCETQTDDRSARE
jgi:hypothetical protein